MTFHGRHPLNIKYLSNLLFDQTQLLNLSLTDQTMFLSRSSEDNLQWKTNPIYQMWNISSTVYWTAGPK